MRTIILSTAIAMAMSATAIAPAAAQVTIQGPNWGADRNDRDCRTVERRVVRNGKTTVTRERRCDGDRRSYREGDRRDRYVERRDDRRYDDRRYDDRRDNAPGITIGR